MKNKRGEYIMNWYLENGKDSDVVISTRIRLARNINNIPFESKCSKENMKEIINKLSNITDGLGYNLRLLRLKDMDNITKLSLVEKRLVSPEFVSNKNDEGAILINDDENICIMINEEDHLRIQVFSAGLETKELLDLAIELDEKINSKIDYATNEKYGFLTNCPTDAGTGMRASVMLHLPGLTETGNIRKVLDIVNSFGMNIRGMYGEGTTSQGNIYQISNKQSLGISEKDIIKNLELITEKIIEQERLARKHLGKNSVELEDAVYRAYGILNSCKKLSLSEARELMSRVKLGTDLGIIKEMTDSKVCKLDLYIKNANLQKYIGKQLEEYERDIKRAEVVKQIIAEN